MYNHKAHNLSEIFRNVSETREASLKGLWKKFTGVKHNKITEIVDINKIQNSAPKKFFFSSSAKTRVNNI